MRYLPLLTGRRHMLPVFKQSEAAECGLVCLAMIAEYWNLRVDVASMRQRFATSSRGLTLQSLTKIASSMGLSSRAVRVDLPDLKNIRLPAIMHWDFKHFVVLKSIGRSIVIHDPKAGQRKLAWDDVSQHFTGVILELWPSDDFLPADLRKRHSWRDLMGYPRGLSSLTVKLLVIGLCLQAITVLIPLISQWGIDNVAGTGDLDLLEILSIGLAVLIAFQAVMTGLRNWAIMSATTEFILHWKIIIFENMTTLPMQFFHHRRVGDITSRFESVEQIIGILNDSFVEGCLDSMTGLITAVLLLVYNPFLSIITYSGAAVYVAVRVSRYKVIREYTIQSLMAESRENSSLIETIRGMRPIKLFAQEKGRGQEWISAAVDEGNAALALSRVQIGFKVLSGLIGGSEQVLVFYFALKAVASGTMTLGMLFAFTSYRLQFFSSVSGLIDNAIQLQTVKLHADRVADIVLAKPEEDPKIARPERIDPLSLRLNFVNVSFKYGEFEREAIKKINLEISEGDCVAFVGRSGCGKSTIISLIAGLIHPTEGHLSLGDIPYQALGLANVRAHVAAVMQDDILFSGSIAQNIAAFASNIDMERVRMCAYLACVDDDIKRTPMGFGTLVTDMGQSLSGGQRQRICIARALYKPSPILLFDEATSHMDLKTEALINQRLSDAKRTRIIIAHRIDTIKTASRLILIDNGNVVADSQEGSRYQDIIDQLVSFDSG